MKTMLLACCLITSVGLVACDRRDEQPIDPSETTDTAVAPGAATGTDPQSMSDQGTMGADPYGGTTQGTGTTTSPSSPDTMGGTTGTTGTTGTGTTGTGTGTGTTGTTGTGDNNQGTGTGTTGDAAGTTDDTTGTSTGDTSGNDGGSIPPTQ